MTAHRRLDLGRVLDAGPPLRAEVHHWAKPNPGRPLAPIESPAREAGSGAGNSGAVASKEEVKALSNELVGVIRDLVRANPLFREQTQFFNARVDLGDPFKLADFAAALTTAEPLELQRVLEARCPAERLRISLKLVRAKG